MALLVIENLMYLKEKTHFTNRSIFINLPIIYAL
jgi:hypothetical protein